MLAVTVAFSCPWLSSRSAAGGTLTREMRPSRPLSVNQTLPSGPRVIPFGSASASRSRPAVPPTSSLNAWLGVAMRPIRPGCAAPVNHSALSPPSAMPTGRESGVRPALNSRIVPSVLIRPMAPGSSERVK